MKTCPQCDNEFDGAEMFCPHDGTRLDQEDGRQSEVPEVDPYIGQTFQGRYKILSRLGEGGMGVVYVAEHIVIEKKVALKVLREDFSKRPEVVARFRQEAKSASKIGHENIVDVTDFGQMEDGGVYFVMEYLEGKPLNEIILGKVVDIKTASHIVRQIAKALKAAHEKGIVHRDLKPENIFIVKRDAEENFVKILDFGIAKISDRDNEGKRLTKTGMIFGTPEYMSPEQAAGKELDHKVDVYALGCIMFEMFTGDVPFDGESFMSVLTQHMFEPIPRIEERNPDSNVPDSVKAVVYKAMAKDRSKRYADMDELRLDLDRAVRDSSYIVEHPDMDDEFDITIIGNRDSRAVVTKELEEWAPEGKPSKKSKMGIIVGITVFVVLAAVGGWAHYSGIISFSNGTAPKDEGKLAKPISDDVAKSVPKEKKISVEKFDEKTTDEKIADEKTATENDDQVKETKGSEESDSDTQGAPKEAVKELISVKIETVPTGAVISVSEMGQVCGSSPCEIKLPIGEPVEIEASLNRKTKKVMFTPSIQNKSVKLKLKKPGRVRVRRNPAKNTGSSKSSNGLRIPNIFGNN